MLVSRKLIESVLPDNFKQLIDENNSVDDLNTIVENLLVNLEQVKIEINDLKKYGLNEIEPEIKRTEEFSDKINTLHKQLDDINNELDEQESLLKNVSQIEEYKNLIDQIEMINKIVIVFEALREFEVYLSEFKSSIDSKNYSECYELLNKLTKISNESNLFKHSSNKVNNLKSNDDDFLQTDEILIIRDLREDFVVQRERLWFDLDSEWNDLIKINDLTYDISINKAKLNQTYLNQLTLFSTFKTTQIDQQNITFVFTSKLKHFSKQFLNLCQQKIINTTNEIEITSDNDYYYFKFKETANKYSSNTTTIELLEYKLNQIETLLKFLYENIFKYQINALKFRSFESNEPIKISLMYAFSDLTIKDFINLIHEQLITNIIPLNEFDYGLEEKICEKLSNFEENVRNIEYLKNKDFKNFMSNVEELYVRKKCKFIMESARNMMKNKDLIFELIRIEDACLNMKNIKSNNRFVLDLIKLNQNMSKTKQAQETDLLKIPKFSVSKLVKEILNIVNETLNEAFKLLQTNNQSLKSVSLFCLIAHNLFDLYLSVIPSYYANKLKEIPQLSAIIFNDFYYLSLNCLILGHKYKTLIKSLKTDKETRLIYLDELISNFNFVNLIPKLYSFGYEILFKQIEIQEKNLIQFLNEDCPNGIRDLAEANNYELFKKSLQKCIYQLNNLATIWIMVLSENLYFKVFGQMLDLIINDLVKSCLKLEDISSDDASYLHEAFLLIKQAVFDLFTKHSNKDLANENNNEENDLVNLSYLNNLADLNAGKYIKTWQRFKYLMVVLKAGLQEIVDLWSDGKGPLALCYDSEEVRHLIRALFMITDRRSAALAKIK